jgi:predicted dehydrogenase
MGKVVHVGFCGAGGVVKNIHVPNLEQRKDRYTVTGFFDVATEKARELAGKKYRVYDCYADLLEDPKVDLVVIATKPLSTHYSAARQALESGKNVLLDKPMAATTAECDELLDVARRTHRLLTVHHNRRLNLDFLALQDVLSRGRLGEPKLIINSICNEGYQGGDFEDMGVHLVDQALLLNRSRLLEVSALLSNPAGGTRDGGCGEVTLRFAQLPLVRVSMIPRSREFLLNGTPPLERFYAFGSTGTFVQRIIEDPRDLMNATQNFDRWHPDYVVPDYLQITQKDFYDYLYESMDQGKPLLVKPESARNAIRVLELMVESARTNRTVAATGMLDVGEQC